LNKAEASLATRNGAIATLVVALMTCLVVSAAIFTDASGPLVRWNDPIIYIDAVLLFVLALAIYKHSRTAAIIAFIYYLVARLLIFAETGAIGPFFITVLILFFMGKAVFGAFAYHRLKREDDPSASSSKWGLIIAIPAVLLFSSIIGIALFSASGVIPSTMVLAGTEMRENESALLRENNIVSVQEKILYFYSEGLISVTEGGSVLTNDRVIAYYTDELDELHVYEIPLYDVGSVILETQGNSFNDSVYLVQSKSDDDWIRLFLSTEQKGDVAFINALREKVGDEGALSAALPE